MAHAHHDHAMPSVVEGRTGFRRGAAFIIGGLSSGHGVFHWIAQSFIVVLPEVRDLLLGAASSPPPASRPPGRLPPGWSRCRAGCLPTPSGAIGAG